MIVYVVAGCMAIKSHEKSAPVFSLRFCSLQEGNQRSEIFGQIQIELASYTPVRAPSRTKNLTAPHAGI
jgi:hypothetical protein